MFVIVHGMRDEIVSHTYSGSVSTLDRRLVVGHLTRLVEETRWDNTLSMSALETMIKVNVVKYMLKKYRYTVGKKKTCAR